MPVAWCRCGSIRRWVLEETANDALGQLLHVNDRLHATLSRWRAVSEELAKAQEQQEVHPWSALGLRM